MHLLQNTAAASKLIQVILFFSCLLIFFFTFFFYIHHIVHHYFTCAHLDEKYIYFSALNVAINGLIENNALCLRKAHLEVL